MTDLPDRIPECPTGKLRFLHRDHGLYKSRILQQQWEVGGDNPREEWRDVECVSEAVS